MKRSGAALQVPCAKRRRSTPPSLDLEGSEKLDIRAIEQDALAESADAARKYFCTHCGAPTNGNSQLCKRKCLFL